MWTPAHAIPFILSLSITFTAVVNCSRARAGSKGGNAEARGEHEGRREHGMQMAGHGGGDA